MPPEEPLLAPVAGSDAAGRMRRFVTDLLTAEGALVEPIEPDGLEVLAPPPVREALGFAEVDRLGFGAAQPPGAHRVGLEGDWLDRFGRLLGEHGRSGQRVLVPEARLPGDPGRVLERELVLDNATFRLLGVAPAWTRYLVLAFRYSAVSDEKRDGVLWLGVNLATSALPDAALSRVLFRLDAEADPEPATPELPADAILPPSWQRGRVLDLAARALPPRLEASLAPFVHGLHRRFERDRERLHLYHNDLFRDAVRRRTGAADESSTRHRDELRVEAVRREYRAKLDDLTRQYALRVSVEWVQTLDLAMPVQRFTVQLRRRKAERLIHLDWNPLARQLEPPPCEATFSMERPRLVCDEALHLVAPAGLASCSNCGKPFCRACHPRCCPRCGGLVQHPAFHLSGSAVLPLPGDAVRSPAR